MNRAFKAIGSLDNLPDNYACMAFDLGRSSTGVAVGNSIIQSAQAIGAIKMQGFFPKSWLEIHNLIVKWEVNLIIVGDPKDTPNTAKKMLGFAKSIHAREVLPVVLIDESYTTKIAEYDLRESGQALSKAKVDSFSAMLLIKHWFDLYA